MFELMKLDLRKVVLPWSIMTAAALLAAIVIPNLMIGNGITWLCPIMAPFGGIIGYLVFHDPGSTRAFCFSRSLTRRQVILARWSAGMLLQILCLAAIALAMTLGVRSAYQIHVMDSPFYPMIRFHDLLYLRMSSLVSFFFFQLVVFLMAYAELARCRRSNFFVIAAQVVFLFFCLGTALTKIDHLFYRTMPEFYFAVFAIFFTVTWTAVLHSYKDLEI